MKALLAQVANQPQSKTFWQKVLRVVWSAALSDYYFIACLKSLLYAFHPISLHYHTAECASDFKLLF